MSSHFQTKIETMYLENSSPAEILGFTLRAYVVPIHRKHAPPTMGDRRIAWALLTEAASELGIPVVELGVGCY
jgi:hypothetical protein